MLTRRLTRALAAAVLGVGVLAPAATFMTQGTAHAVLDTNGDDDFINAGQQNGPFDTLIYDGDNITLFSEQNVSSAHDVDTSDFGDFDLFQQLINSAA